MSFLNLMRNKLKPKRVNEALSEVSVDVSDLETAVTTINGTITNTIIPRLPKDYSSTDEVNIGQKWIDGKDIYCISGSVDVGAIEATTNIVIGTFDANLTILNMVTELLNEAGNSYRVPLTSYYVKNNGVLTLNGVTTSYANGKVLYSIFYTKPDPEPEPTEAKKRTKKTN